jgi:methoxymalonate biosynthesis acyl carrier protein
MDSRREETMNLQEISNLDIRAKIVSFIKERTGGTELQPEEDIFATGYVSSLFIVQLITWMERTFDFRVAREDLDIGNFRNVEAILRLVERKQQASGLMEDAKGV